MLQLLVSLFLEVETGSKIEISYPSSQLILSKPSTKHRAQHCILWSVFSDTAWEKSCYCPEKHLRICTDEDRQPHV